LVVDPNAVLSTPIALERFEAIPRRNQQIVQVCRCVEIEKLSPGDPFKAGKRPHELVVKEPLGVPVGKASDHNSKIFRPRYSVKRNDFPILQSA
jgi:hypothetical protein